MSQIILRLQGTFVIVAVKKVCAELSRSDLRFTNLYFLGHWIQACPTNNDPKFDGKYRVKRSTGIPRSLQTKVEKPESLTIDGSSEDLKNTGVMVNADGDFVIAKPDKAAWELYQEKAKASAAAAAEAAAAEYSKELQNRGLECPIDKRMFLEPTKTPCCQRTYCNDCISNALIESDFVCPGCATEGVLLDNLSLDEEAISKIKTYEAERAESKKEKEKQQALQEANSVDKEIDGAKNVATEAASSPPAPAPEPSSEQPKKRPAEDQDDPAEPEGSVANSSAKKQKTDETTIPTGQQPAQSKDLPTTAPAAPFNQQMPFGGFDFMQGPGMPGMPFPDSGFPNDGMGFMNPMGGFPGNMDMAWNPMNAMNAMNPMNFNPLQNGMYGDNANNGFVAPNMYNGTGAPSMPMFPVNQMAGSAQQNQGFQQGPGMGNFMNQQRTSFSTPFSREEDTPYFRQPVNPQRNQARHRRIRPSDYREL